MFLLEMLKEVDWVDDFFAAIYDNFEFKQNQKIYLMQIELRDSSVNSVREDFLPDEKPPSFKDKPISFREKLMSVEDHFQVHTATG